MEDYSETFESKVQDIRLDGPDINTSILENIDNSIGWAKANHIEINFNKHDETLTIKDNGENGFGSKDALKRFFKLGKANKGVTTGTIGKYGKGGYKSIINISRRVDITSYFNDKKYVIGTNFTEMIETNSYTPNIKLTITDNEENMKGSIIKLNIRAEYVDKFNTETLIRFIKRAYHNFNIVFIVNDNKFNTSECKLYDEVLISKKFKISYDINKHIFCDHKKENDNENDNEIVIGELEYYVLRNMLTKIDLLGNSPGIDFYRNNRLCNAKNPIRNIGEISRYLDMGQMRGMRCHMAFRYNNVKLTDTNDVDSSLGLNTTKEICEDENKFNKSLRELLENKSKECSNAYEKFTSDKKAGLEKYLSREKTFFSKMEDNVLLTYDIDGALKNYKNFQDIKTWDLDENMEYKFYDNKKAAIAAKTNGATVVRKNSEIIVKYVNPIVQKLGSLIKKKETLIMVNSAKVDLKEKYDFTDEQCSKYLICQISIEALKREIINLEENKSYDDAMSKCDEIIKIATESEFKTYFEEYLDYAIEKLNTIRIDKDNLEKITDIISVLDERWDKATELFKSEDYEGSKTYFNKVIEFVNALDGDISEDILEYKTDSISEISTIDDIIQKRLKLEEAIEFINTLTKEAEQIDKKEIEGIKKINEKIIQFIDSKDNIDIKGDLKTYKITAEKKIKSLKPKKVKQKIDIANQKSDIAKYSNMNHNDIKEDDWETIKLILKSFNKH